MRIIVLTLIMTIGFSGFTAAAHASADVTDHMKAEHVLPDDDGSVSNDCEDCTHCCVSHAINPTLSAIMPLEPVQALNALPVYAYSGDHSASLLRPPKTLA